MTIAKDTLTKLFHDMLRIRLVQLEIEAHYLEDEMKTPIHLYIGQEAIAVGISAHLTSRDYINSNHRSHGHYLAKGGDLKRLMAELFCRATGCSKGRGGSMHLIDVSVGHMGSSSIVGGGIPLGTGMAFAAKMQHEDRISVVYFGDGAADEGVVYESFNFAMLKKLPVLYVLENNGYSVCSTVKARQAGENIFHRAQPELMPARVIDGNDVMTVYEAAGEAVRHLRAGRGPYFLECRTYRIRGHAGAESQDPKGYRSPEEIAGWKDRCPLALLQKRLLQDGVLSEADIAKMTADIQAEIAEAFAFARQSPFPADESLSQFLFCE